MLVSIQFHLNTKCIFCKAFFRVVFFLVIDNVINMHPRIFEVYDVARGRQFSHICHSRNPSESTSPWKPATYSRVEGVPYGGDALCTFYFKAYRCKCRKAIMYINAQFMSLCACCWRVQVRYLRCTETALIHFATEAYTIVSYIRPVADDAPSSKQYGAYCLMVHTKIDNVLSLVGQNAEFRCASCKTFGHWMEFRPFCVQCDVSIIMQLRTQFIR